MGAWIDRAACRDEDPEIFFPIGPTPARDQISAALEICGRCRVRGHCLSFAVDTGQTAGVWAGTTEEERRTIREEVLHGATR